MHNLTYTDLNGKPRLRRYVIAVAAILLVLGAIAAASRATQGQPAQAGSTPPAAAASMSTPSPTPTSPTVAAAEPAGCPEEPEDWAFIPILPGNHYQRIEPVCAYEGLARAAAWMLLERMGHSKTEAAQMLGLADPPWEPAASISGFTSTQGPQDLSLITEWPAHPEYRFWQLDREGRSAVALGLRGCYLLEGTAYCVLALDRSPGSAVGVLGDLSFASHAADRMGSRSFQLLAYRGGGAWVLLGEIAGSTIEIESQEKFAAERTALAERLGAGAWDSDWLEQAYGFIMQPLPQDWRLLTADGSVMAEIGAALNAYVPQLSGGQDE